MPAATRSLLLGQIGFFAFLGLCLSIDSAGLSDNHGWSYYGGRSGTFVPYLLGFLVLVLLIGRTARLLERSSAPPELAGALRLLAVLLLLDVATPDTLDAFFYWAHDVASALLFLFELGFGFVLVWKVVPTRLGRGLLGVQLVGGLLAMFSQLELLRLLGVGILLFQLSFGALLLIAVTRIAVVAREQPADAREEPAAAGVGR